MSTELTTAQRQGLVDKLRTQQSELAELITALDEGAEIVDLDAPIGRLSRMDAMQQQEMAKANLALTKKRLVQTENALKLVDKGEFGFCRECDEPIAFKRLQARPETPFCLACQSERE